MRPSSPEDNRPLAAQQMAKNLRRVYDARCDGRPTDQLNALLARLEQQAEAGGKQPSGSSLTCP